MDAINILALKDVVLDMNDEAIVHLALRMPEFNTEYHNFLIVLDSYTSSLNNEDIESIGMQIVHDIDDIAGDITIVKINANPLFTLGDKKQITNFSWTYKCYFLYSTPGNTTIH